MVRGDLGRRLLAQLIDALWMMPLAFALVLLGLTLSGREALSAGADLMLNLVLALLVLRFWATRQATPGKWALGLRIVAAEDGGPVPLPTRIERYTVMRSPFVDKDSQEHFELRTHKRLIDVLEPSQKTISALMRLNLPAGVDIEVKL